MSAAATRAEARATSLASVLAFFLAGSSSSALHGRSLFRLPNHDDIGYSRKWFMHFAIFLMICVFAESAVAS